MSADAATAGTIRLSHEDIWRLSVLARMPRPLGAYLEAEAERYLNEISDESAKQIGRYLIGDPTEASDDVIQTAKALRDWAERNRGPVSRRTEDSDQSRKRRMS